MVEKIRLEDRECPLSSTLGLVGEWWTVLILHDVFDGYHRFDQFQANLGISSSLLTARLRRLVDAGILTTQRYQDHPPRHEYHLTELGRSLRPVLVVLAAWGNNRLEPAGRSMVLVDADTGIEAEPVVVDRTTGRRVDGPDFVFTAGPAASTAFTNRYRNATPLAAKPDEVHVSLALRSADVAYDAELVERIRALVADESDLTEQTMFGGLAFLIGGNMAVAASGQGGLLVRADPAESDTIVAKTNARPMEIRGKPMQGWLRIDSEDLATKRQLTRWVTLGTTYARSLPAKRKGERQSSRRRRLSPSD